MKILISTDIEGIAGVFSSEQTHAGHAEYEKARLWMAAEANAAASAVFNHRADHCVYINDSHGHFRNMPADLFDLRVQLIQGKPRYLGMVAGVELAPDALFMIGYHAKSKSRGILAHTINGMAFSRIWLNELELGEAGLYGALAGEFGVPIALASGDDCFIAETQPLFPQTTFVETKIAQGQYSGISLTPAAACKKIYHAVSVMLQQPIAITPFIIDGLITCRLQTQTPALADLFAQLPMVERVAGDMVTFTSESVQSAIRIINSFSAMSSMLR